MTFKRTLIGVCLDESGSMEFGGKAPMVRTSFNDFLRTQARLTVDDCELTLVKFNMVSAVVVPLMPIGRVPELTLQNYSPGGGTALYDAVLYTITTLENAVREGDRVLVAVITDGEENSSRETTLAQLKDAIKAKEERGWTFVYLSAGLDAFTDADKIGVYAGSTVSLPDNAQGISYGYKLFNTTLATARSTPTDFTNTSYFANNLSKTEAELDDEIAHINSTGTIKGD